MRVFSGPILAVDRGHSLVSLFACANCEPLESAPAGGQTNGHVFSRAPVELLAQLAAG